MKKAYTTWCKPTKSPKINNQPTLILTLSLTKKEQNMKNIKENSTKNTKTLVVWKDVVGFEGIYQVSNTGLIKSLVRKGRKTEKILKPYTSRKGYQTVVLRNDLETKTVYIHIIMAEAFLGQRVERYVTTVDHIDHNPSNNHLSNLQILSHRANSARRRGMHSKYEGVTKQAGRWVARLYNNGKSQYLGCFLEELDAAAAYQIALLQVNVEQRFAA